MPGVFFFFQAEDGIRDDLVTGVQTCALPISCASTSGASGQPNQALSPLARTPMATAGLTQSAPECQVWNMCQPPWPGGVFTARRAPTEPQSGAPKTTVLARPVQRSGGACPCGLGMGRGRGTEQRTG